MQNYQRLYISPLNPELLKIILSEPVRCLAKNITYHTLQTFPDKQYGYVDLPVTDADRLKKKLHASILQGVKMKMEKARPDKVPKGSRDVREADAEDESKQEKNSKRTARREEGVLPGVELPKDRKVKRGWTASTIKGAGKSKKGKKTSKEQAARRPSVHTDEPECLFKTKVPPNAHVDPPSETAAASASKKRKRGNAEKTQIVHEFEKTIKYPNFLRNEAGTNKSKPASSYVDGVGWIDEDGEVVEAESASRRTRSRATDNRDGTSRLVGIYEKAAESTSKPTVPRSRKSKRGAQPPIPNDETSSSGGSSSGSEEGGHAEREETSEPSPQNDVPIEPNDKGETGPDTDQVRGLSISRSSPTPPPDNVKDVHPLEALFKRPKSAASQTPRKPALEVSTGFSFFEPDAEQDHNVPVPIPQTPFTQQDFQERRLRSAAPTPDTAAPSKTTFGRLWSQESGREDIASDEDQGGDQITPTAPTTIGQKEPEGDAKESEFSKWFYEHRGETNRAWKRRRREAAKEKRQKDNKRR